MAPWWLREGTDDIATDSDPDPAAPAADERPRASDEAEAEAEAGETPPGDGTEPARRRRKRRRKPAATADEDRQETRKAADEPRKTSEPRKARDEPRKTKDEPRKEELRVHLEEEPESPPRLESLAKEIIYALPQHIQSDEDERKMAMFCDLENVALGVRDSQTKKFDINLVLERLLEKGKIIVKKAYADWERYSEYKRAFHEAAIELIDIPQKYYSGKNSADIRMVVDAMDLCYSKEHLDTFVILSGDSDFSPLVSKLKENNKYVIGVGVKNSSSNLLISNCDEFIYYEDVWRDSQNLPRLDELSSKEAEVFSLLVDAVLALSRENKEILWGSMIKQTMQRKRPSFNEGYYGYSSFSDLLEDAERKKIVELRKDKRSGSYVVTGFANGKPKAGHKGK